MINFTVFGVGTNTYTNTVKQIIEMLDNFLKIFQNVICCSNL